MLYSVLSRDTERERERSAVLYSVLARDTERGRGQLCCIVLFYLV